MPRSITLTVSRYLPLLLAATGMSAHAESPFAHCVSPAVALPAAPTAPDTVVQIDADSMHSELENRVTRFEGSVHLTRGTETLDADQLRYNSDTREVDASGRLRLVRPDIDLTGSTARYNLDSGAGVIQEPEFILPTDRFVARGRAEQADLGQDARTRFDRIVFSTCRPEEGRWAVHADKLLIDKEKGVGSAKGAQLELLGVTLPALPELSFPTDRRGLSGWLVPSVSISGSNGTSIEAPYYWRIADDQDLTLAPRFMSKRGVELNAEYRFLTPHTRGELSGSLVPRDLEYEDGTEARGKIGVITHSEFGAHWVADIGAQFVTDHEYTIDLGDGLYDNSGSHLERRAQAEYRERDWRLLFRVQDFQTIDDGIAAADRPYARLPQVRFDWRQERDDGLQLELASEYVHFVRDDSIEGHRVDLTPTIGWAWREPWAYVNPRAGLRFTRYDLRNTVAGQDATPARDVAILSLDSGLFYERPASLFGRPVTQTLEPRLHYLYVPHERQNTLPVFDSSRHDLTFDSLFRTNRFSGADRQGDANRVTLAMSSRALDESTGRETLSVHLAETFHLEDENVTLPGEPVKLAGSSSLLGEIVARLDRNWLARGTVVVDTDSQDKEIEQSLAQLVYRDDERRVLSATWRQRDGSVENTDLAAAWPLSTTTRLLGRWNYSLREDRTREWMAGVETGNCCWHLRLVARRYADTDNRGYENSIMLQIELNGLGHLGDNVENFIRRGIYAYRTENR